VETPTTKSEWTHNTKTLYKGQKIVLIKMCITHLFYSTYTIDIHLTQMMMGKSQEWVKSWGM